MKRWMALIFILLSASVATLAFYRTSSAPPNTATFAGVSLTLDYATTPAEHERGLGGRTDVPEGYGMLFIFAESGYHGFWMKDTRVPLDIFWLDEHGRVVFIEEKCGDLDLPTCLLPYDTGTICP